MFCKVPKFLSFSHRYSPSLKDRSCTSPLDFMLSSIACSISSEFPDEACLTHLSHQNFEVFLIQIIRYIAAEPRISTVALVGITEDTDLLLSFYASNVALYLMLACLLKNMSFFCLRKGSLWFRKELQNMTSTSDHWLFSGYLDGTPCGALAILYSVLVSWVFLGFCRCW